MGCRTQPTFDAVVGKLVNCTAKGDVELRKVSVLYADNGRGKTTISDILRSLQTGDPSYVMGRSSLGQPDAPEITIRLDTDSRTFKNGAWDQPYPQIVIFDDTFVHENVYTGIWVGHEQRKNLYHVIVGAKGVTLARRVDELDEEIREISKEIKVRLNAVEVHVPQPLTADQFLALPSDPNVDERIAAKEVELRAAERATEITAKPELKPIQLPQLSSTLERTLARQLADVQQDAEVLVRQHITAHHAAGLEQWLSRGMAYATGQTCPFCGQGLTGSQLITALRAYFSQSYNALKEEIGNLRGNINEVFSEAAGLREEQQVATNGTFMEFWREFVTPNPPAPPIPEIQSGMQAVRAAAVACIEQKAAAPLEPVTVSPQLKAALVDFGRLTGVVAGYNEYIRTTNAQIAAAKKAISAAHPAALNIELARLRAAKKRHADPAATVCTDYSVIVAQKRTLEAQKASAKIELNQYTKTIFTEYQERLNKLLDHFGAGFHIGDVKTRYAGGPPSSTFHIILNDVPVELGDSATPRSKPSFRNTLSAGDRRTLALAFFLAQLERDADLAEKIAVFDDPFTSLDKARRTCTQQTICALVPSLKQVIVLSHDAHFLRLVYDGVQSASVKALQLARDAQATTISEWDIEKATREDYFQHYDVLREYVVTGKGEPAHVVRCIRPLLEKYLRVKFPEEFGNNEWLGNFIDRFRTANRDSVLGAAKLVLPELEAINDYSKRYHHAGGRSPATELINEEELQTYAKRALSVIGEAWICPSSLARACRASA